MKLMSLPKIPAYRYEVMNGKRLLADRHSLHVTTGDSTGLEINEFCEELIKTTDEYVTKHGGEPLNKEFRKNVVVNVRNGVPKMLGWSILFFKDSRVYNLAIGKEADGSERLPHEISPVKWKDKAPSISTDDILIKIPQLKSGDTSITPVIRPYYIEEGSNRPFIRGSLVMLKVPLFITEDNIRNIFKIYSSDPDYPLISSFESYGYRTFKLKYKTNEDMLFARAMQMMTYFEDPSSSSKFWSVKVQREFKSSNKRR